MIVFIMIFCFLTLIFFVLDYIYADTYVVGNSMYPTLNATVSDTTQRGDHVYINKFAAMQNGNIVVADASRWGIVNNGEKVVYIIKRLVAQAGDTLKIVYDEQEDGYYLYVNGEIAYRDDELYFVAKTSSTENYYKKYQEFLTGGKFPYNVGTDEDGDACIIVNAKQYFLMGDNWSVSADSMMYGTLTKSEMSGRVDIIVTYGDNQFLSTIKGLLQVLFA